MRISSLIWRLSDAISPSRAYVAAYGLVVSNAREASLERVLARGCWTPVERFNGRMTGASKATTRTFVVALRGDEVIGETVWSLSGEHNRANAAAALLAARHVGVPFDKGLDAFRGTSWRLELRGVVNRSLGFDDFAHHPTAIATTVAGLRRKIGSGAASAGFSPCSNRAPTPWLGVMKAQLPASLAGGSGLLPCRQSRLGRGRSAGADGRTGAGRR